MKEQFEILYHENEQSDFWSVARMEILLQFLKKQSGVKSVLDIGCATGMFLQRLINDGYDPEKLYGVDISERAVEQCKKGGIQHAFVMDAQNIQLDRRFDMIVASDCLEHLEEDHKALANWYNLLEEGGRIMIFVPAFMFLWSAHDEANMHYRRYTKKELAEKLEQAGFQIKRAGYWNFFLFFPVFILRLIKKGSKSDDEKKGDFNTPNFFNWILLQLLRVENTLLRGITFPFGISTFCIAEKK